VLHLPTTGKIIRELRGNYRSIEPSIQALLQVISFCAVMSLEDEEVRVNFGTEKGQLLARYRLGTEQALAQADFLNTHDMTVIQAFTIYLVVLQHTGESRSGWFLAGVLVRVAVSMKLHRDGSQFENTSSFEMELRRRLWWQICLVDSRSEDVYVSQFQISEGMFDTAIPMNIDDANLNQGRGSSPMIEERWTDMTVCIIRCEVWKLSRRLQSARSSHFSSLDINQAREIFRQTQSRIEDKYFKHLNPNIPLHSFVTTMTRLFLTKVGLILNSNKHSNEPSESKLNISSLIDKVFMPSLYIVEYSYALLNEPSWSGWVWQIQGRQPPWHALYVVFTKLNSCIWEPIHERAWSSAKRTLNGLNEADQRNPPYQQLIALASSVQRNQAKRLAQDSEVVFNTQTDLLPTTLDLSAPFARVDINENTSYWNFEESNLMSTNDLSTSNNLPSLEMDWQAWDEIYGEVAPSLEFWDMGGL
jgi:hypothetical protein